MVHPLSCSCVEHVGDFVTQYWQHFQALAHKYNFKPCEYNLDNGVDSITHNPLWKIFDVSTRPSGHLETPQLRNAKQNLQCQFYITMTCCLISQASVSNLQLGEGSIHNGIIEAVIPMMLIKNKTKNELSNTWNSFPDSDFAAI